MDDYLHFAKTLALQAGDIMTTYFNTNVEIETKEDATPLTVADSTINEMVLKAVKETYPAHGAIGEEGSNVQNQQYVWVCDPIDGTIPFSMNVPVNLFALALVKDGESVLGILYDPYTKRMYEAVKGKGAFLNGKPIQVNDMDEHAIPAGLVSMPGMQYGKHFDVAKVIQDAITKGERLYSLCCATYEAALVAVGSTTGAIFPGDSPWDVAATKVIVEEAGGKVTDLWGNEQRYDQTIRGAIISNGVAHDRLVELMGPHLHNLNV